MPPLYEDSERNREGVREDGPLSKLQPAYHGSAADATIAPDKRRRWATVVVWRSAEWPRNARYSDAITLWDAANASHRRNFDFLNGNADGRGVPRALANAVQSLNVTDMFSGKEKEYVFSLLPGEERLDELTIHHQHLFSCEVRRHARYSYNPPSPLYGTRCFRRSIGCCWCCFHH